MERLTVLSWLGVVVIIIFAILYLNEPVEEVLLSFDTELADDPETVEYVLGVLDEHDARATFFFTGEFALRYPELTREISAAHEVACHTMTHPRLAEVNETQLWWELGECKRVVENITNTTVLGFRAPYNLVDERTFVFLPELEYVYDASTFENFGWFYPKPSVHEIPISALGPLPLEDHPLIITLKLGDFAFFLMRMDKDSRVSLVFHPRNVFARQGAFEYLVSRYADDDVAFVAHQDVLQPAYVNNAKRMTPEVWEGSPAEILGIEPSE